MKRMKVLFGAALPLALSIACGGSASDSSGGDGNKNTSSTSSEGKDDVCDTFCDELEACDGVVIEECVDSCTGNKTTSVAGQNAINECFDASVCEELSEEALLPGLICLVGEVSDIDLSEEAEEFCDDSVDTINRCLESEPDPEAGFGSCETLIGLASDELLEDVNDCASLPCDEVEGCLEVVALTSLPIDTLLEIENGGELSPAIVADLLSLVAVFGQLGFGEEATDLFAGAPMPDDPPPAMGGSAGR